MPSRTSIGGNRFSPRVNNIRASCQADYNELLRRNVPSSDPGFHFPSPQSRTGNPKFRIASIGSYSCNGFCLTMSGFVPSSFKGCSSGKAFVCFNFPISSLVKVSLTDTRYFMRSWHDHVPPPISLVSACTIRSVSGSHLEKTNCKSTVFLTPIPSNIFSVPPLMAVVLGRAIVGRSSNSRFFSK